MFKNVTGNERGITGRTETLFKTAASQKMARGSM
jgi:hypothetical protein